MAEIATCPKCAKQIGLPATADATDRVECPECCAAFSMAETVQITLPVARLLPPEELPADPPATLEPQKELVQPVVASTQDETSEIAEETNSSQSWEERLKRALALDASQEAEPPSTEAIASNQDKLAQPVVSPSFEFQLDPPPKIEEPAPAKLELELPEFLPKTQKAAPTVEQEAEPSKASVKTLADFAASAVKSAADTTASVSTKAITTLAEATRNEEETVATETAKITTTSNRRVARRGFPKVAAFVAGPIAGSLLGLYGLLWLQGERGDHLGLSHLLPTKVLPASFGQTSEESEVAASEETAAEQLAKDPSDSPSKRIIQDGAIKLASASGSVPPARITASEFVELVEAAEAAMSEFLGNEMTSQASIKLKGQAYMSICQLSEHFDFARQPALSPAVQRKVDVATKLFLDATTHERNRQDLAHIAGQWWRYDKRNNAGIFFTGQVQKVNPTEEGDICWVQLSDASTTQSIPVWMEENQFQSGDQIGVVGRLITAPDELPREFTHTQIVRMSHGFVL